MAPDTTTDRDFDGRVAIVTGAAGAIGGATARLLAARGAGVAVADLDLDRLDDVVGACRELGAEVLAVGVDQSEPAAVDAMVAATVERFGRLDVLANVAGIWDFKLVEDTSLELWERTLRVNLTGTFLCCRAALPALRVSGSAAPGSAAPGSAAIVNVSSGSAFRPVKTVGAYAASKGGIVAFSRVLAEEAAPEVRVNVVAPGPTETATHEAAVTEEAKATTAAVAQGIPLGRMAKPSEIAEAIVFAASSRASFMTGNILHVNGGRFIP